MDGLNLTHCVGATKFKRILKKISFMAVAFTCFISYSVASTSHHHTHTTPPTKTHEIVAKKHHVTRHHPHEKKQFAQRKKQVISSAKKHHAHHHAHASPIPAKQLTNIEKHNLAISTLPGYLLTSIEKHLVDFVHHTIASVRYSVYKLGGRHFDTSHGVYIVDCSGYVDHILKSIYPQAYSSLVSSIGSEKPTTDDFYHYFNTLSNRATHWNTIEDVEELRPGDILVFRYKNSLGYERGGHVMIVMDKPTRHADTFSVRVTDSASGGHSKDTRQPRSSGIGIGTLLLKVNPKTYQPYAYAWKVGSHWDANVSFAMARPLGIEG